jgi:hypothetical protein
LLRRRERLVGRGLLRRRGRSENAECQSGANERGTVHDRLHVSAVRIAATEGSSTGPHPEFGEAEARPVSCACTGQRWIAELSLVAQEVALLIDNASLLIELVGHRSKNDTRTLVVLAIGEIATMLGMEPKLLCGAAH